ncbi:MAG: FKBP-type peptidyl-prolyl cis-trans isomerase [Bacteroidetes bacterium]|nr:FKBP-type peptidyl-prolyl cis-trans isomerase [Bacteroidota bacterium]MBS1630061.1 FKBP-type peptidyl-prolyl cis-trans isomerase [Bacteroidota bacterium]
MKNSGFPLLILLFAGLAFSSCSKSDTNRCASIQTMAPTDEVARLQSDLNTQGIHATNDSRGFYYIITRTGNEAKKPSPCSQVRVSYTLRLMNGTQLEAANNQSFLLSNLITGWQEGLPLIGEGGYITLFIPPSLAYGSNGSGSVPPSTNLMFQIELVAIE